MNSPTLTIDVVSDVVCPWCYIGKRKLEAALDDLPARCRETFVLRKIDELSQREVAKKMGISEATVEKHMVKAMRILTDRFWNAAPLPDNNVGDRPADHDEQRG